jgi:hypothetical protein
MQEAIYNSLDAISAPTVSAGIVAWLPDTRASPENLALFSNLHGLGAVGALESLASPWDLFTLVRTHSAGTMSQNILKVGEFEVAVKTTKITGIDSMPRLKPFIGDPKAPDPSMFLKKETMVQLVDGSPQTDPVEV